MFNSIRGDITLSAFNIEQSNILVFDNSEEAYDGFFLTPGGEARSRDVELNVNAKFNNGLALWLFYAYVYAESTNDTQDPNFLAAIEPVENLLVRAEADNLFDKEHYTNSFPEVWVEPGAPRRFRVSATYRF